MADARHRGLASAALIALSGIALYYMRIQPDGAATAATQSFERVLKDDPFIFPESEGMTLRRSYTGIAPVDGGLSFLVAAFTLGASGLNKASQLQQVYFLTSFVPVLAILSIEAGRIRNAGSAVMYTSAFLALVQTVGGAIILPIWLVFLVMKASGSDYYKQSPALGLAKAQTLLAAMLIGYILPTILLYNPYQSMEMQQLMTAFWQPCPVYVNLIWWPLYRIMGAGSDAKSLGLKAEISYLRIIYGSSMAISALAHIAILYQIITSTAPGVNLWHVFVPDPNQATWPMSECLLFIFQVDFWIIFIASLAIGCYLLWDMRKSGVMAADLGSVVAGPPIWVMLFGPGALLGAIWWSREEIMLAREAKSS